jgi:hypothetical protein
MLLALVHAVLVHNPRRSLYSLAVDKFEAVEGVVLLAAVEFALSALRGVVSDDTIGVIRIGGAKGVANGNENEG